jgi:hypothetical protein
MRASTGSGLIPVEAIGARATDFEAAGAAFEAAWRDYLPIGTGADVRGNQRIANSGLDRVVWILNQGIAAAEKLAGASAPFNAAYPVLATPGQCQNTTIATLEKWLASRKSRESNRTVAHRHLNPELRSYP